MSKVRFRCYFCGEEAEKYLAPDTSIDEMVECSHCVNRYRVTFKALYKYLNREKGNELLTKDDRFKLSEYVRTQDVKNDQAVLVDSKVIEKVTGKKSISYK
jgi:hypothetical protein